jgi:DMSO/TMAO reductase YedYZ molybdopterin-dependent catalytic subunit
MTSRGVLSHFWREALTEDRPPWHIVCVDGHVRRPLAVTALDLSHFPQRDVLVTGTQRGVPLAGTGPASAIWRGVDVGRLLDVCGVEDGARFVAFHSGDRRICLSVGQMCKQNAVLALRTNDHWLSAHEGGPCRLILAGSRGRDFGGPIDRIQVSVDRPVIASWSDPSGTRLSVTPARAA